MLHNLGHDNPVSKNSQPKILAVEDDEINRILVKEILELTDFSVTFANNGQECLDKVAENDYDLILMDIQMPIMDGIQATLKLRQTEAYRDIPIIAVTANLVAEEKNRYFEVGMNDYVSKPIVLKTLLAVIEKWLGETHTKTRRVEQSNDHSMLDFLDVKGIDISAALSNLGGETKTYLDILSVFKKEHVSDAGQLKIALQQNDIRQARFIIHSLRGLLGTVGAFIVLEYVKDIHSCLKNNQEISQELMNNFQASFSESMIGIEKILQHANIKHCKEVKPIALGNKSLQELEPLVKKLKSLLELCETDSEEVVNEILHEMDDDSFKKTFLLIQGYIKKFEFEEAHNILTQHLTSQ